MNKVWFTADPHFGHRRVAELRGFTSTEEHDEHIRDGWNKLINPLDIVWVLGDLAMKNPIHLVEFVNSLNGVKHLIAGNHDRVHPMHRGWTGRLPVYLDMFASVAPFSQVRVGGYTDALLSHFPYGDRDHTYEARFTQWRLPNEGMWLLHGHIHSKAQYDRRFPREIHVGMDAWAYRPAPADAIVQIMIEREQEQE